MRRYGNLSGNSGVTRYELGDGRIIVQFEDGWRYEYTNASAGAATIAQMHKLATAGRGLSGFIATTVRGRYARKFR